MSAIGIHVEIEKLEMEAPEVAGVAMTAKEAEEQYRYHKGKVISLGHLAEQSRVKVGDTILYDKVNAFSVQEGGEMLTFIKWNDIVKAW